MDDLLKSNMLILCYHLDATIHSLERKYLLNITLYIK